MTLRIGIDYFLISPNDFPAIASAEIPCEIVSARAEHEVRLPVSPNAIMFMEDPEEEQDMREREMHEEFLREAYPEFYTDTRPEWVKDRKPPFFDDGQPDVLFFWLDMVTPNSSDDPDGLRWRFMMPAPERQEWLVNGAIGRWATSRRVWLGGSSDDLLLGPIPRRFEKSPNIFIGFPAASPLDALREVIAAELARLRSMPYPEYLDTRHWQRTRLVALRNASYRCEACGAPRHLDVHHLTYIRRGAELPEDLRVLCRDCHEKEHGIAPKDDE